MPKAYLCGKLGIPPLYFGPNEGTFGDSLTKAVFGENWGARRGHLDGSKRVAIDLEDERRKYSGGGRRLEEMGGWMGRL
jgi:hypothetical protein